MFGSAGDACAPVAACIVARRDPEGVAQCPHQIRVDGRSLVGGVLVVRPVDRVVPRRRLGGGLGDERIRVVEDGDQLELGQFRITVYQSRHMPYPSDWLTRRLIDDSEIPRPLVPPASAFDYKLGKAWILLVEHPAGSFLISGSAGFIPGQLSGIDVDAVFVGVGGLGSQSEDYREAYWRETVTGVQPEQIIPVHWDSLLRSTDLPLSGELRLLGGGDTLRAFLLRQQQRHPDIRWWIPPRYEPVVLLTPGK